MSNTFEKRIAVFCIVLAITSALAQIPYTCFAQSIEQDKAVAFLRDVARLDLSKYNLTYEGTTNPPNGSVPPYTVVVYTLSSVSSSLRVFLTFVNGKLIDCSFDRHDGSLLAVPCESDVEYAKGFFQRYQNFSGVTYLQELVPTVDSLSDLSLTNQTQMNIKFTASKATHVAETDIAWNHVIPGYNVEFNSISLSVRNGVFNGFTDDWSLLPIGGTIVDFNQTQAEEIAKQLVQANYTVADDVCQSSLQMNLRYGKLYPLWFILVPLARVYDYGTTMVEVLVWADTGEVLSATPAGMLGLPPDGGTPSSPSTSPHVSSSPATSSSLAPEPSVSPIPSSSPPQLTTLPSVAQQPAQFVTPEVSLQPSASPSPMLFENSTVGSADFGLWVVVAFAVAVGVVAVVGGLFFVRRKNKP